MNYNFYIYYINIEKKDLFPHLIMFHLLILYIMKVMLIFLYNLYISIYSNISLLSSPLENSSIIGSSSLFSFKFISMLFLLLINSFISLKDIWTPPK